MLVEIMRQSENDKSLVDFIDPVLMEFAIQITDSVEARINDGPEDKEFRSILTGKVINSSIENKSRICKICGGKRRIRKGKYCNPHCRYLARLILRNNGNTR